MRRDNRTFNLQVTLFLICLLGLAGCGQSQEAQPVDNKSTVPDLSDADVENIIKRSYQYVAMYNVNNKSALDPTNPLGTGGWNRVKANTRLADHTLKAIARPNNDTLYVVAMLDLRSEPVILEAPAFDSKYLSLMVTGYDHYVNIPMSTRLGDFSEPSRILFYTERTGNYAGEAIDGIDKISEMSGDFVSAVYRIMPHTNEPKRMKHNLDAMNNIKVMTLSEYQGRPRQPVTAPDFPAYGQSDFDIYENNLLEVMQFVFNHSTFESDDEIDQDLLTAFDSLGVVPGRVFDSSKVAQIDGARFRRQAEQIAPVELAKASDPEFLQKNVTGLFQPKGSMSVQRLLFQSILGPIGQPAAEAVYPAVSTTDGKPMNAQHDYVVRMTSDEMPPANAFWSLTLYDLENGFFIPNDGKKYSVGENTGMKLDDSGGIAIFIAAEQPEGVPEENWLPLQRGDYNIDIIMRLYSPDLERFATWTAPRAEIVQ
jgi:hypothetical protein